MLIFGPSFSSPTRHRQQITLPPTKRFKKTKSFKKICTHFYPAPAHFDFDTYSLVPKSNKMHQNSVPKRHFAVGVNIYSALIHEDRIHTIAPNPMGKQANKYCMEKMRRICVYQIKILLSRENSYVRENSYLRYLILAVEWIHLMNCARLSSKK